MIMIRLPWPDNRLSPNARTHWAVRSPITKAARSDAAMTMLAALRGRKIDSTDAIPMIWVFCPPDKRQRDRDNIIACCKALQDGIADALGINDARFEPTYRMGEPVRGGAVIVKVAV